MLSCAASACGTLSQLAAHDLAAHTQQSAITAVVQRSPTNAPLITALALLIAAVYVVIPLVLLARARPVTELDTGETTRLYAAALADALKMDPDEAALIPYVLGAVKAERASPQMDDIEVETTLGPVSYLREFKEAARLNPRWHATVTINEWWDGSGPTGAPPSPLAATIAIAEAWAKLTTTGGPAISHEEALYELGAWTGTRYDPEILDAAARIVRRERRFTNVPAFQPRLHRLRQLSHKPSFYVALLFSGAWALLEWHRPSDAVRERFPLAGPYPAVRTRSHGAEQSLGRAA